MSTHTIHSIADGLEDAMDRLASGEATPGVPALKPSRKKGHQSAEAWAQSVRHSLTMAVEGFVNAGRDLAKAKASGDIPHGEWENWIEEQVGISQPTAHRLMALAAHPVIANHAHGHDLPPSWRTLYELSRLEPQHLETSIANKDVTSDTTREQAVKIVKEFQGGVPASRKPKSTGTSSTATQLFNLTGVTDADVIREYISRGEDAAEKLISALQAAIATNREIAS